MNYSYIITKWFEKHTELKLSGLFNEHGISATTHWHITTKGRKTRKSTFDKYIPIMRKYDEAYYEALIVDMVEST